MRRFKRPPRPLVRTLAGVCLVAGGALLALLAGIAVAHGEHVELGANDSSFESCEEPAFYAKADRRVVTQDGHRLRRIDFVDESGERFATYRGRDGGRVTIAEYAGDVGEPAPIRSVATDGVRGGVRYHSPGCPA